MSLDRTEASLDKIIKPLSDEIESREFLIKNTRDVISMCSRAIIAVHAGDTVSAAAKAKEAAKLLRSHKKRAAGGLRRYLAVPEQELVEALSLIAIVGGRPVPSRESLGVSGPSYVLGLLDCIGELKRLAYDRIRAGDAAGAQDAFRTMEGLYNMLYPFAAFDKVIKEARRKLDVARILIEDTRAAVTEEARRAELLHALRGLRSMGAGDGI
ncbi:RNA-binding protein [Cenarchaeum symbiosum A]|uniref:RNA-binding protein n=1 Tax=Cenarchaeum symbiosum (strain A) TaxID=414004 RepID=A0RY11_CENSY|nr:RNA-binding protein [Cenarchaeum symbiosum A]